MKSFIRFLLGTSSLALCLFSGVLGQTNVIRPVQVGGKVANQPLKLWYGDSSVETSIHDFKGKLLLLDFWATGCSSCVASLPDMLELQHKYGDKIRIIEVTPGPWENDKTLKAFWKKMEGRLPKSVFNAARELPFVKADTIIHQLFPHDGNGYVVWIDSNGIYRGMGTMITLTAANIEAVLNGTPSNVGVEYCQSFPDRTDPLVWAGISASASFSLFTNRLAQDGLFGQTIRIKDPVSGDVTGLSLTNQSIAQMYKLAYSGRYRFTAPASSLMNDDQLLPEMKNKEPFLAPGIRDNGFVNWSLKNLYCYGVKITDTSNGNVYDRLIRDLDNRFGYQSAIQYRKIRCLVLRRTGPARELITKGGTASFVLQYHGNDSIAQMTSVNGPFYMIQSDIEGAVAHNPNFKNFPTPAPHIVNETGYDSFDELDYSLPNWWDFKQVTLEQLQKGLRKIGLDLVIAERSVPVLVIKDAIAPVRFSREAYSHTIFNKL